MPKNKFNSHLLMKKKILFLSRLDPYDIKSWSGLNFFILNLLKKKFQTYTVGPLSNRVRYLYLIKKFFYYLLKIKFDIDRPILVAKDFARQIEKKIKDIKYDAILTSDTYLVSFLKTKKPIFIWTDFAFGTYYDHYFSKIKISKDTLNEGNYCEKIALKRSKRIILTSRWAVNSAVKQYKINKKKFNVLQFGANLNFIPDNIILKKHIYKKNFDKCRLLTVGVSWERKGMSKAIELMKSIESKGTKVELYIIGSIPPKNYILPSNVIIIKFLNKNNLLDQKILANYYLRSHFHILFSKAEASAVVYSEASAFGLYTITHDLGGTPDLIENDVNGYRFDINKDNMDTISDYVLNIYNNQKLFIKKSLETREQYNKKLNWDVISKKLYRIIDI
jgi:glycosyltransferase involved in cell wall biosynthesis